MAKRAAAKSVDEYIAGFPPETREALEELRLLIREAVPGVTEKVSYAIPAFFLNGCHVVYIAGWKKHIGLYPVTGRVAKAFEEELEHYTKGKATLQFPLGKPMPTDLIRRLVVFRAEEITGGKK